MITPSPSRPRFVWLVLDIRAAAGAPGPRAAPVKVSLVISKLRLNSSRFSFPLATIVIGTVTLLAPVALVVTIRTAAGGMVTARRALLLVADPAEFVTTTP